MTSGGGTPGIGPCSNTWMLDLGRPPLPFRLIVALLTESVPLKLDRTLLPLNVPFSLPFLSWPFLRSTGVSTYSLFGLGGDLIASTSSSGSESVHCNYEFLSIIIEVNFLRTEVIHFPYCRFDSQQDLINLLERHETYHYWSDRHQLRWKLQPCQKPLQYVSWKKLDLLSYVERTFSQFSAKEILKKSIWTIR